MTSRGTASVSFVAFSCLHAPLQDEEAFSAILETIAREKPDVVVHLGDGHEMSWASKYDDAGELPAAQEYESHHGLLARIRKAPPPARRSFLPGNHEWRLYSPRIEPGVREALLWTKHEPEFEHWEQPVDYIHCRHRGVFRLGQVVFCHGFASASSAVRKETTTLCREFGLYVHGHTHRPTQHGTVERIMAGVNWPLNFWRANPGCCRELSPAFMGTSDKTLWGHGVVVGRAQILKSPRANRCWEARTEVFKTYDQWARGASSVSSV